MSKRASCPHCGSFNIKAWALGKIICRRCRRTFSKLESISREYTPEKRRSKSTRKQADRQEKRVARNLGARQTIASGQTPIDKGDVRAENVRVECKYTDKKSFSLKAEDLQKIANAAQGEQIPLFYVEFREHGQAYYVVPEGWFTQLLEVFNDQDN
jgi:ribosomal protein L37AE/L43A